MKMLQQIKKAAKDAFIAGVERLGTAEVEKRDGVFVARYLSPESAQQWHDWAVKYGIPSPVPANELHVTVLHSTVDVKLPMSILPLVINVGPDNYMPGQFAMFGPDEDNLVFTFWNYALYDRNSSFIMAGAMSTWPSYRPHLTLSTSAAGFEIPDPALADMPAYIILGPEVNADIKADAADDSDDAQDGADDEDPENDSFILVIEVACSAAKALLEADKEKHELAPMDAYALADVAAKRVSKGVAKRLAATDWAPPEIKDLAKAALRKERVLKSQEVKFGLSDKALKAVQKNNPEATGLLSADEDRRLIWSIASVSTIKDEKYFDVEDEHFTTVALEEFAILLTKSGGAGKFEHQGEDCNRIVQIMVLSNDVQKSLGFDLEMEPMLICTEIAPDRWDADVKQGGYRDSIAGVFYYYEDEE
jgi:hypothetical protein